MNPGKRKKIVIGSAFLCLALVLSSALLMMQRSGLGESHDAAKLARFYSPAAPQTLVNEFRGEIYQVLYTRDVSSEAEPLPPMEMVFNYISPDANEGQPPRQGYPFLAFTRDNGHTFSDICEIRTELPDLEAISRQTTYDRMVELLRGEPTVPAWSGESFGDHVLDMVSWSLCTPINDESVRVLYISTSRYYDVRKKPIQADLENIIVRSGVAEISEQAGAGQPATSPDSDSEGGGKPQPESEGRSR